MPSKSKCSTWLSSKDEFGDPVALTFKNEGNHGTALGGACSIFMNLLFITFISLQLYGLAFKPGSSLTNSATLVPVRRASPEMLPTSYTAFPVVGIFALPGNPRVDDAIPRNDAYNVFINIT